jgi:hypothetical protein
MTIGNYLPEVSLNDHGRMVGPVVRGWRSPQRRGREIQSLSPIILQQDRALSPPAQTATPRKTHTSPAKSYELVCDFALFTLNNLWTRLGPGFIADEFIIGATNGTNLLLL